MGIKVKVCGMGSVENAVAVSQLEGVSFVGFIHHEDSPRHRNGADFILMRNELPEDMMTVVVCANEKPRTILTLLHATQSAVVQLHGSESPETCAKYSPAYHTWKTLHLHNDWDPAEAEPYYDVVHGFVFDTKSALLGGSGKRFDWSVLERYQGPLPFMLSGGIGPEHAEELLQLSHPKWRGIDLNSRFEIEPGKKDIGALADFLEKIKPLWT